MRRILITPATVLPVSVDEIKLHRRIDQDLEDQLIEDMIHEATNALEEWLNVGFTSATYEVGYQDWPDPFYLLPAPIASIVSVIYTDPEGNEQTVDPGNYMIDNYSRKPVLAPAYGYEWPESRAGEFNDIKVRYISGVASAADVDPSLKSALKLAVGSLYENRESVTPVSLKQAPALEYLTQRHWIPEYDTP